MKLEVSLGYEETGVTKMGIYVVDEVEISHPPANLRINAKAADMVGPFRSPPCDKVALMGQNHYRDHR